MNKFSLVHKNFTIPFAFAVVTLVSCGGGGGGETASPAGNSSNVDSSVNAAKSLDDLYIDQTNELAIIAELNIEVRVSAARSFLSVCPESAAGIDVSTYNYDKCMIRAPLEGNLKSFKLSLPNHIDNLVAIVWFYEVGKQPLVTGWQRPSVKGDAIDSIWQISETG